MALRRTDSQRRIYCHSQAGRPEFPASRVKPIYHQEMAVVIDKDFSLFGHAELGLPLIWMGYQSQSSSYCRQQQIP
jgi:hypothetical protein